VNNHAHVLRAISGIATNQYLKFYFDWFDFHAYVNGTTRQKLTQGSMNEIPVRLPPPNEQRRIVAKLEKLLDKVNACRQRLDKIPTILKRFRQSALAAACSGRLTADWREQKAKIEPVSVVLEEMRGYEWEKFRCEGGYDTPEEWVWIKFSALVASIRGGSTVPPQNKTTDYPLLRSSSVRPGVIAFDDIKYLRAESSKNPDNFIQDGDILFTRLSGSIEYLANCALVRDLGDRQIQYPDRLFCAKLKMPSLAPYIELSFASPVLRTELTEGAKSSAGHQRVTIPDITNQRIPLPPLPEQLEIVRRVEELFALTDRLEARYKKAKIHIDKLTQSILAKAFRGELVPQDPNDEPVSELLERIKEERKREIPTKKAATRKSKRKG
jgi:type I restriction enzyme, S subunit